MSTPGREYNKMSGPGQAARVTRDRGSRVADLAKGRGSRGACRRPPATANPGRVWWVRGGRGLGAVRRVDPAWPPCVASQAGRDSDFSARDCPRDAVAGPDEVASGAGRAGALLPRSAAGGTCFYCEHFGIFGNCSDFGNQPLRRE